jgi:type I restriction enzyme S subunit
MINSARLQDVCDVLNGYAFKSSKYTEEGIRVLRITNVQKGIIKDEDPKFYPFSEEQKIERYLLKENDLLVSLTGNVGRVGMLSKALLPAALNQRVACIRTKDDAIDINFLFHYLNSDLFENNCISSAMGIAQKNLSTKFLNNYQIPLPPLSEQKRIVAILDKAQQLIDLRKQQLTKLDELIQSIFYDMFGDPVTNPKGWEKERFGTVFTISSGGTPSKSKPEYWENGTIPWIGSNICKNKLVYSNDGKFITELGLKKSSAKIFPENTILVALVGATIGKTALLKFETTTNQNIAGIIVDDLNSYNPFFIFYYLQALYYEFMNIGEEKFKMANLTFVRNLEIGHAPISLQNKFAAKVQKIEEQKNIIQQSLAMLEENFKALQQRAFRGHL